MKAPILLALPALLISGCASLTGPSAEDIARLPVVRFGQPAPADGNFVLLYPADADLPVIAKVDGSLFAKTDQTTLKVRIKQDIYTYRDQVSFDGKTWHAGASQVVGTFNFTLPGWKDGKQDGQSPGQIAAEFNLK
ncbi:MAG: hypothetical protein KA538_07980 [Azonexus sp.]|jgi:hypothetical protein|nr:hypothetical protein [Azonexus sp.]